jgi:polysaccharide chain length determinant protein (PEP-CTERM system associated)
MERKPPSSVDEFVSVIQRRKYWIIIPSVAVIVVGALLTPLVPRTYKSTTTIMVTEQNVPSVYVKSSGGEGATRLEEIDLQVMKGTGFPAIIEKFDLYPKFRKKASMTRVIAAMRKDISVDEVPDAGDGRGGVLAFTISYIGRTPQQAQEVTQALAQLFMDENLREGRERSHGAYTFLTSQLNAASQRLSAQQAKIQGFKMSHLNSLPEQAQANMQTISQIQATLQTNEDALAQANQQRVYLQSVLNVKQNGDQGVVAAPPGATPLQLEMAQKQQELRADLLKYTPQHPDVIRLKHDIAALKVEIANAPKASSTVTITATPQLTGPSMNDQLRGQLIALNADVKAREARQRQLQDRLAQLQGSVGGLPAVQTEFAALTSEYEEMQKNYNALLEQQQEAAMMTALEQREQAQQFAIAQPANLPIGPFAPNPLLLHMGVVLIGLLIGVLLALVVEIGDDTMHSSDEVASYLKLPVMVSLPKCSHLADGTWSATSKS